MVFTVTGKSDPVGERISGLRFMLLSRFCGPEPAAWDGDYELNDIELVK
jgi:hypothetical protein